MKFCIRPLLLGRMKMNMSLMTYMMNFDKEFWSPIVCWYVQGNNKRILVDTGAPAEVVRRHWYGDYEEITTFENALASVNLSPDEIDFIIQTHLHFDHCGNTAKCAATEILVQKDELTFYSNPHPLFKGSYLRTDALANLKVRQIEGDAQLLPGLDILKVPGHTPGTQAVRIQTNYGTVVLSGFCAINANFSPPEKISKLWPVLTPGVHVNSLQAFASALRIKELGGIIIPIHEIDFASQNQIVQ